MSLHLIYSSFQITLDLAVLAVIISVKVFFVNSNKYKKGFVFRCTSKRSASTQSDIFDAIVAAAAVVLIVRCPVMRVPIATRQTTVTASRGHTTAIGSAL